MAVLREKAPDLLSAMAQPPSLELNNGVRIPAIGLFELDHKGLYAKTLEQGWERHLAAALRSRKLGLSLP